MLQCSTACPAVGFPQPDRVVVASRSQQNRCLHEQKQHTHQFKSRGTVSTLQCCSNKPTINLQAKVQRKIRLAVHGVCVRARSLIPSPMGRWCTVVLLNLCVRRKTTSVECWGLALVQQHPLRPLLPAASDAASPVVGGVRAWFKSTATATTATGGTARRAHCGNQ